jgi:hypothetical protein
MGTEHERTSPLVRANKASAGWSRCEARNAARHSGTIGAERSRAAGYRCDAGRHLSRRIRGRERISSRFSTADVEMMPARSSMSKRELVEGRSEMDIKTPQTGFNKAERQTDARPLEPIPQPAATRGVQLPIVNRAQKIRMKDVNPQPSGEVGADCDCGRRRACPFRVLCAE